jgi:16S rRNA (cytosine1402-N4)-methyltransferase
MEILHYPVLHKEVLEALVIDSEKESRLIDCTTGEGGHTALFLAKYPKLSVTGLDRDRDIQKKAIERFKDYGDRFTPVNTWFDDYLSEAESESADAILFDLGISIFHYEESERGFSFRKEERLDMRLNAEQRLSAEVIVNEYPEDELADVIYRFGEERYSRRIARAINEARQEKRIEFSEELANIIFHSVPREYRYGRIHPATRTFQALRIEVNKELDRIRPALEGAIRVLKKGGRVGVITFHSLEDRIVKWYFKEEAAKENPEIKILTKKPIVPTEDECKENAPSRSSKLRVVEKLI